MDMTIEGEASAGLPPPLLLAVSDASQLIYVLRQERPTTVIQLISTHGGEGVSTLCRDVALVGAADMGLRTLLLASEPAGRRGTDWSRAVYGMPGGLSAIPNGLPELEMLRLSASSLVLAAPAPGPALQPSQWAAVMRELRGRFELIVVDSPSLERGFTGIMLSPLLDATVLVVAAESTRASSVRTLRDRLAEVGGQTAGVILNKRRFHVPRAAYERL